MLFRTVQQRQAPKGERWSRHTPQLEHPQLEQSPEHLQLAQEQGDMMLIEG